MKISLRKANVLQNDINEAIKTISIADSVSINEFQNAEDVISAKALESVNAYQRKLRLINALYSIRSAVSDANAAAGISKRLTEIAHLDKILALSQQMAGFTVRTEPAIVAGKLDKIRNRKEDSRASLYGHVDEVATGVFNQDTINDFKATANKLKKDKQKLQDEILELNVRTEVVLSEQAVQTLSSEGLL
jgi:hypothetical protein